MESPVAYALAGAVRGRVGSSGEPADARGGDRVDVVLAQEAAEAVLHRPQEADAEADPRLGVDVAVGVDGARLLARA